MVMGLGEPIVEPFPDEVTLVGGGREIVVLAGLENGVTAGATLGVFKTSCLVDPGLRETDALTAGLPWIGAG